MSRLLQVRFPLNYLMIISIFPDKKVHCANIEGDVSVIGYIYVFGSGLLGAFLLQPFIEDTSFSSKSINL